MIKLKSQSKIIELSVNPKIETEKYEDEIFIYNSETDNISVLNVTSTFIFGVIQAAEMDGRTELSYEEILSSLKKEFIMEKQDEETFFNDTDALLTQLIEERVLNEF